jgi:hypothetical protein
MANTYTTKLGLAKPANGDVDWHIPINENWDKIDTELDKALKISGTEIDVDKDWGGKNITNVNVLTCNRVVQQIVYAPGVGEGAETLFTGTVTKPGVQQAGSGSTATKTVNRVYGTGTISIVLSAPSFESTYNQTITYEVYKNGVQIYTITKNSGSSYSVPALSETIQVPVTSGNTIYAKMTWSGGISGAGTFTMTASAVLSLPLIEGLIT